MYMGKIVNLVSQKGKIYLKVVSAKDLGRLENGFHSGL